MYLEELPRPQRAVLVLIDTLGWQPSEVAELMDVSLVSVHEDLRRARAAVAGHPS